jgi:hypothetical protein
MQYTQFTCCISAPERVEPAPRRREAMHIPGRRADAGGDVGEVGPRHGGGVVDVQFAEDACTVRGLEATVGRVG